MPESSSTTSVQLNANAVEFIPSPTKEKEKAKDPANFGENSNRRNNTGAIPKNNQSRRPPPRDSNNGGRYYQDNRRYYDNRNNWRSKNDYYREPRVNREEPAVDQAAVNVEEGGDKKFFKNNYNNGNRNVFRKPNNQHQQRNQKSSTKKRVPAKEQISQREALIKEIETNTLECMICCEKIKVYAATFGCNKCYSILHLNCIKTWVKNSKSEIGEWRCPACNQVSKQKPGDYFCFCGKMKNPTPNRNDLAHTCGDMCLNTSNCPHPCGLQCHPGKKSK